MPGAEAHADLTIRGERLAFDGGVGYHDKNWGDVPFGDATRSWYWGHARLGPYTLVWFDSLARTDPASRRRSSGSSSYGTDADAGAEYVSGYVADGDGNVLLSSCTAGAARARPFGNNSQCPPDKSTGNLTGFVVEFALEEGDGGILNVTVWTDLVLVNTPWYGRYAGRAEGGLVGGERLEGRTVFKEFRFDP